MRYSLSEDLGTLRRSAAICSVAATAIAPLDTRLYLTSGPSRKLYIGKQMVEPSSMRPVGRYPSQAVERARACLGWSQSGETSAAVRQPETHSG